MGSDHRFEEYEEIHIRDLSARCIIGFNEEERVHPQDVLIQLIIYADLTTACRTDRVEDTVDYKRIKKAVLALVESSSCYLLEHLTEQVAQCCLTDPRICKVVAEVSKPGALRYARDVAIRVTRSNPAHRPGQRAADQSDDPPLPAPRQPG